MRVLAALLALVLVLCGAGYYSYTTPSASESANVLFYIPHGTGLSGVAQALQQQNMLSPTGRWVWLAAAYLTDTRLKSGEYQLTSPQSPQSLLQTLQHGKLYVRKITFAEGITSYNAAELLNKNEFLNGAPLNAPPEGALLPQTYFYSRGDNRFSVLQRAMQAQQQLMRELWPQRAANLPYATPQQAVVMASIIERETALPTEHAAVAAVFVNRLRLNMRLQSDPTVIYGIAPQTGTLGRPLTHTDLRTPTPYNTYTNNGLPPTPIANAGEAALRAALQPLAGSNALYFVANGMGGHNFADTLEQHNANVAAWRAR